MTDIYIDTETLQSDNVEDWMAFQALAKPRAGTVDPVKVERQLEEAAKKAQEKSSLDGTYGSIAVICLAAGNAEVQALSVNDFAGEGSMLQEFFDRLTAIGEASKFHRQPFFIGHNVGFDLRFIHHRSVIKQVHQTVHIPYNASPWGDKYFCTQYAWCGARDYIKLKELARVMGIADEGDLDGAAVQAAWEAGEYQRVTEHCVADVERVRKIHQRLPK